VFHCDAIILYEGMGMKEATTRGGVVYCGNEESEAGLVVDAV